MTQPTARKRILMVDDQLDYIQPYAEALEDEDFDVTLISQVDSALEMLREGGFDVIILDMLMPPSEGVHEDFEDWTSQSALGASQIREDERLRDVPITFITAGANARAGVVEQTERVYTAATGDPHQAGTLHPVEQDREEGVE